MKSDTLQESSKYKQNERKHFIIIQINSNYLYYDLLNKFFSRRYQLKFLVLFIIEFYIQNFSVV
jgi:hypothetical protein